MFKNGNEKSTPNMQMIHELSKPLVQILQEGLCQRRWQMLCHLKAEGPVEPDQPMVVALAALGNGKGTRSCTVYNNNDENGINQ